MILPALLVFAFGLLMSAGAIVGAVVIAHSPRALVKMCDLLLRGAVRLRRDMLPGLSARRRFIDHGAPLSFSNLLRIGRTIR